ncbi:Acyl-CoA desaturase-like protein [Tribolium castaneum]|uniref:Acyl-CoA desaturase-like protein n=1 Tax=Tribolium castaneum TaxID=7070 RepID=A0A139WH44_TRICA|nr:Acyl-CoA desaturase-like protein [Tribolium castaneum]
MFQTPIVWPNVILFILYHAIALQGWYYFITFQTNLRTIFWAGQGITSGVHRLWSHRSYKAKLPLRIFLCLCQTISFQNSIYEWARDHRAHHKFSDTDADPHNIKRGFFFAHMGWLLVRKHPQVKMKGQLIDLSDLENDPVVRFQKKYYHVLAPLCCFVVPTMVPWYFWKENFYVSFCVCMLRYLISLHFTWLVNSAAHLWGFKPYDRFIKPSENQIVAKLTMGEGWHNYHHTFPWDYKAAELDSYNGNLSTAFIDLMAKIGWAYDLKTVPLDVIRKRVLRTGQ